MAKTPAAPAASNVIPGNTLKPGDRLALANRPPTVLHLPGKPKLPQLADGIYLNLSNARYHADDALGSSNIRDLLKGANLYWHKSRLNPRRKKDKSTPAKVVGNATHTLLLDGEAAYKAGYVRGPYGDDDDDLTPAQKGQLTKDAKKNLQEGQELLTQEDYDFVTGCKMVIDADPELEGCLDNGLSEVSIFYTRPDGVRVKVRLDKLKERGIGDIKTIANERERPLEQACWLDIATYRYDIPAEHYCEGRRQMKRLIDENRVFVCSDGGSNQLEKIEQVLPYTDDMPIEQERVLNFLDKCAAYKNFGFQLVFIPKKGAPDVWSTTLSQGNPILVGSIDPFVVGARSDIEQAIETYKAAIATYGEKRWLPGHVVEELDINNLPYNFGRLPQKVR